MSQPLTKDQATRYMELAILQAERAASHGEVPIGAVIVQHDRVIAEAHNEVELRRDPTAHAEIVVIQRAAAVLGDWRLNGCTLCVTVEPCTMCGGALLLGRLATLIYGASEPRSGAFGSRRHLGFEEEQLRVVGGVEAERCANLLKVFFSSKRSS